MSLAEVATRHPASFNYGGEKDGARLVILDIRFYCWSWYRGLDYGEIIMTPPTDEKLAEFIMALLKADNGKVIIYTSDSKGIVIVIPMTNYNIFHSIKYSPIIRDLIEEEMERREYLYKQESLLKIPKLEAAYLCEFIKRGNSWRIDPKYMDKSKTRAVALAAYNALGGKV